MFFERYDKQIIEEFAIRVISKSFDSSYGQYILPDDTDNFDGVSPDGNRALEITLAVSRNNMSGYVYEKLFAYGNTNLQVNHIKNAKIDPSGKLLQWSGGTIREIINEIQNAVSKKQVKAQKRLANKTYDSVDLCVCIDDGGWFDEKDFSQINLSLDETLFDNIFFITSKLFFRYTKGNGFEQYERIV